MKLPMFVTEIWPSSVYTKKAIKAVRERIKRNPVRKQKILSREMKIAPRTMSRILKDDKNLQPIRDADILKALKKLSD